MGRRNTNLLFALCLLGLFLFAFCGALFVMHLSETEYCLNDEGTYHIGKCIPKEQGKLMLCQEIINATFSVKGD